ncbi:sugar-transfer associated ATP-grasp domain-containing protein [Dongia rigui]|uniref:Sugar-transfer associated ATP-grasp domain-containing protein n=1 Tax=Dongia rigui TaxID=940149 RepID=A0ABU5DX74_9PROT|nr:sugar-transfer associated ATP-grasp domain-containing protein [Dongia rigui]MDY0871913.1 sugar-transfer associated ATP-grasp domain-containing protein [Dongia rigui]
MTTRVLDPRDLIRSILFWALLIPLALIAFIGAEITHHDWVDSVNAIVYAFGAILALTLARQAGHQAQDELERDLADPFGRPFWLLVAVICLVFVFSELFGGFIEHYEQQVSPFWIGDLLCWLAAVTFTLTVARLRPRHPGSAARFITPIVPLLGLGLGLQSIDLGLDVGEPHLRHHFGLSLETYDNITDLLEFAFLQLYLLAFIGLAAEITARHALQSQIVTAETAAEPAVTLRAAQLAFTTATLTSRKFSRRRLQRAMEGLIIADGMVGMAAGIRLTRRLGPSIMRRTGKSPLRQFAEQMAFMWKFGLAPKTYYQFELFDPALGAVAGQYLQRSETKASAYKIMHKATGHRLSEKLEFHNRCLELGLPAAPVVFAATDGLPDAAFADLAELPPVDLFIKPRKGSGGRGAVKWQYAEGIFVHKDGQHLTPAALRQSVIDQSAETNMLVQKTLTNHAALADINCGTLATIRIVTCRNESGAYEVTNAAFRMPRVSGSAVDNFHAGGIASAVDITSGRLGAATDLGLSPHSGWFATHPITGAAIEGRILPRWAEARALVERAHPSFSDFAVIGWDVAILEDGPCIIEANGAPDLDIIQRTARAPLGNARLGRLMAWHVKRDLRGALLG